MQALLGTRKGLIILKPTGKKWSIFKTHFDGVKVSYADYEPFYKRIWAGVIHGHWGPKLHYSTDKGKTFKEVAVPKFPTKDTLKDFWAMASDSVGRIYIGVEPAGIFYSDDKGESWEFLEGLAKTHGKDKWVSGGTDASCVHCIFVHPQDDNHLIIGISVAGVLESKDRGRTWAYINKGLNAQFLPDPNSEIGQDPHMIAVSKIFPHVLWQQNHCGIFKSEDMGQNWQDLSKAKGLKSAFGWGIVVDEEDPDIAYTVPALSDETRIPVGKKLVVQKTENGGKSWKILNKGLPDGVCYDIIYRNALALKEKSLMFGSTTGNLYFSHNEGGAWNRMAVNFPPIYSVKLV